MTKEVPKQVTKEVPENNINVRKYYGKYKKTNIIDLFKFYMEKVVNSDLETHEIFRQDYFDFGFNKSVFKSLLKLKKENLIENISSETGRNGWAKYRLNLEMVNEICSHDPEMKKKWKRIKKTFV